MYVLTINYTLTDALAGGYFKYAWNRRPTLNDLESIIGLYPVPDNMKSLKRMLPILLTCGTTKEQDADVNFWWNLEEMKVEKQ